ncbi:MAG: LysR family transcriptional regulator [Paenibacillaceae bacterium]|jgi:LysR family transcriptional activator of glutamate synthase operon|nr:LysR family transcriptional regulator [Paenibacillaceae bacterium]
MELRQLHYFVTVAQMEHITHASQHHRIAQSAMSRQIHLLEQELGVQLFTTRGRNVQITHAGRFFYERIAPLLQDIDRACIDAQQFEHPEKGEVRIGFPHSLGIYVLPTLLASYRKTHQNVKFVLQQGTYPQLIDSVLCRRIDLAFISPFPPAHDGVHGDWLMSEPLHAILPHNHPFAQHKEGIRLDQLQDESFVMFSERYSLRAIVLEACAQAGFVPHIGFEGEETDTIRGLVAAGLGVSMLPAMALVETGPIMPAAVPITHPEVVRTVGLIQRKQETLPRVAEAFRLFLIEQFQTIHPIMPQ